MSVIEVKATRTTATATDPAEAYVLKSTDRQARTKTPYVVGVVLMGIVAYLKSIFSASARTEDEPWAQQPDGRQPLVDEGINEDIIEAAQGEAALPHEGLEDDGVTDIKGSGGRLVSLQDPMEFMLVDAPEFDFSSFATGGPVSFRPAPPPWPGTAANDNRNGSPAIDTPSGPGDPDNTGDPDTDDADDPTDPVDPQNPDDPAPPGPDDPDVEEPCENDEDPAQPNRAPRVTSTVCLMDATGCAMFVIALSDLLRHATDPDGDPLSVKDVTVSSGTIIQSGDGWLYQPAGQFYGSVTISYQVSDGEFSVAQSAHFEVVRTAAIEGSDCDDTITGTACADEIDGRDGDDIIDARAGNDTVQGGNGDDTLYGGDGDDNLCGGAGNDIIFGGAGDDVIHGGSGKDLLSGGFGNDLIFGDEGDDTLFGDEGDDILHGGEGTDMLAGGLGNDQLFGDEGNDRLFGNEGDDILSGGDGVDFLDGGVGDDTLDGGTGNDVLSDGAGSDLVEGGEGDDMVLAAADGDDDRFDGGEGTDTIDYSATGKGVMIDTVAGLASGCEIGDDTISGFEAYVGGSGDDHFIAGDCPTILTGGDGDDIFEFLAPVSTPVPETAPADLVAPDPVAPVNVTHAIVDFRPGDIARMSRWDIFEETMDRLEDHFERIYGDDIDADEVPIRFRYEQYDDVKKTIIEADLNFDDHFETTVLLDGHRAIVITEHC